MIPQLALVRRFFAETESQSIQLGLVAAEALFSSVLITIVPWSLGAFLEEVVLEKSPTYHSTAVILVLLATILLFCFRFLTQVFVRRTVKANSKIIGAKFLIRLRKQSNLELDPSLRMDVTRVLALPLSGIAPTIRFTASVLCLSILAIALNQHILFEPFTTAGGIALALFFFTLILTYTKSLPDAFLTVELASESATRIFKVLDRPPLIPAARTPRDFTVSRSGSSDEIVTDFQSDLR